MSSFRPLLTTFPTVLLELKFVLLHIQLFGGSVYFEGKSYLKYFHFPNLQKNSLLILKIFINKFVFEILLSKEQKIHYTKRIIKLKYGVNSITQKWRPCTFFVQNY